MLNIAQLRKSVGVAALALLAGAFVACEADSPTVPSPTTGGGGVPSGGGTPGATWNIGVTAQPNELQFPPAGSSDPVPTSTVIVDVRNAANGQRPPANTTVVVVASGGTLVGCGSVLPVTSIICQLINGQVALVFTPTAAGGGIVRAQIENSVGSAVITILGEGGEQPFALSHVSPGVGSPAGGDLVRINLETGSRPFENPVRVLFGGVAAEVVQVSTNNVRVRVPPSANAVPPGTTLAVTVSVTNAFGTIDQASDSLPAGFIYSHGGSTTQPQVFSVTPTTGPQEGNTRVVINGSGFLAPVQVLFQFNAPGIQLEAPIEDAQPTQLIVRTPDIRPYVAAGTLVSPVSATIRVVNLTNGFSTTATQSFFYGSTIRITSVAPGQVSFQGNEIVTIFGSGFDDPAAVGFGGAGQLVLDVTGTEIRVRTVERVGIACDARTPNSVSVTNIEGGASALCANCITIVGPLSPRPSGVTPTSGAPGAQVTITGSSFPTVAADVRVTFGGVDGSTAAIVNPPAPNATSVRVVVPNAPTSFSFATEPCDGNGDGIPGGTRNIPTPIDITVHNTATGCSGTITNAFTLTPPNATCTGDTSTPPVLPACSDGADNDNDGFTDAADLGCSSTTDNDELSQCQDGLDNDGDTFIDLLDPQCTGVNDNSEST